METLWTHIRCANKIRQMLVLCYVIPCFISHGVIFSTTTLYQSHIIEGRSVSKQVHYAYSLAGQKLESQCMSKEASFLKDSRFHVMWIIIYFDWCKYLTQWMIDSLQDFEPIWFLAPATPFLLDQKTLVEEKIT